MKKILIISLIVICLLFPLASANAFSAWSVYGDGWIASNNTYTIVMWNTTGNHTWLSTGNASSVDYLVIGGGGSGGKKYGAGGGAGGFRTSVNGDKTGGGGANETPILVSGVVDIIVGTGGAAQTVDYTKGYNGTNSSFGAITSWGGGGGGASHGGDGNGLNGGSGGGGQSRFSVPAPGGTALPPTQGFVGGAGHTGDDNSQTGGGGGGAGSAGTAGGSTNNVSGSGGTGLPSTIMGMVTRYAGGGGSSAVSGIKGYVSDGGGIGGGVTTAGTAGTPNTGGGGGAYGADGSYNSGAGGSGIVIIRYLTPPYPPTASFTCTPTSGMLGTSISCTDTSTTSPTNWIYYWNDGTISTTQNPSHTYGAAGTYSVNQTVNNSAGSSWYNRSNYITITNVSGFTQQDLWQTGHYTKTLHIVDSSNAPIPVVTVTDSNWQSYTTTNGTAYFTEDAGVVVFYFASTGYVSKSMSYVIDGDSEDTVQMVAAGTPASQNTWWTPHTVQITLMDASYGFRLTDVAINATYNESAMPIEWITQLYGIQSTPAGDMVNKTLRLGGTTGSDGTLTTTMLGSLKYDIYLTSATYGLNNYHVQAYPSDSMLNIYVATEGAVLPTNKNSTYTGLNGTRVYFTEPDIHNVTMCVDYIDSTGNTQSVTVNWTFANNGSVANTTTFVPGATLNTLCYTLPNIRGTQVYWGYNASRVT